MLVKNESASSSNNTNSRSSYDKLVCDNLSGSLTSINNQSLSAFVVPFVGQRQNTESSSSLVSYDNRPNSNGSSSSSYRSVKRRRLDTIISELNHYSTGSASVATVTETANGQQVYQRRASLLNEKCLAECCANQVGDISSTTSTSDRNVRNFSSLISRSIALQLAAAAATSHSSREDSHLADYHSLVGQLSQSLQRQEETGVEKLDNLAVNLSCYDRQRENSNNCIRASASKLSQVTCPQRLISSTFGLPLLIAASLHTL